MSPNTENKNIIDQAKGFIPGNAAEAGAKLDEAASSLKKGGTDAADNAQKKVEEKKTEMQEGTNNLVGSAKAAIGDFKNASGQKIKEVRESIADATKPEDK